MGLGTSDGELARLPHLAVLAAGDGA